MMRKRTMENELGGMDAHANQPDGPQLKRQCTESSLPTTTFGSLRQNNTFSSFVTNSSPKHVADNLDPVLAAENVYQASMELAYRNRPTQEALSDTHFEERNGAVNHQAEMRARFDSGMGSSQSSVMEGEEDMMMDMGDAIDAMSENAMTFTPSAPAFTPRPEAVESMGSSQPCMMPSMVSHMVVGQATPFKQRAYEYRCMSEWNNDYY